MNQKCNLHCLATFVLCYLAPVVLRLTAVCFSSGWERGRGPVWNTWTWWLQGQPLVAQTWMVQWQAWDPKLILLPCGCRESVVLLDCQESQDQRGSRWSKLNVSFALYSFQKAPSLHPLKCPSCFCPLFTRDTSVNQEPAVPWGCQDCRWVSGRQHSVF